MKKALILLFILVFPSAIYVYFAAGKANSFVRLNYFGPKQVIHLNAPGKPKTDTIFYILPPFSLYDQRGTVINSSLFAGHIWIAYFVHIHDKETAPPMAVLMNRIEERTDRDTALRLVTFTLDSESAQSMQQYATTIHSGSTKRLFLSGNVQALNALATDGFYKPAVPSFNGAFNDFFLIDKEGHIRGIYNGGSVKDVDRLIDEVNMLEGEYFIKNEKQKEKEDKGDHDAI